MLRQCVKSLCIRYIRYYTLLVTLSMDIRAHEAKPVERRASMNLPTISQNADGRFWAECWEMSSGAMAAMRCSNASRPFARRRWTDIAVSTMLGTWPLSSG
jgi:hypothetical protein